MDAAERLALRGADAVHFAAFQSLQQRLSSSDHQVILVTSDRELKEAATDGGYAVLVPGSTPGV
jgi:rRNA-processing protein FCF1